MIRSEALDIINKIEKDFEVNTILYKGIKVWPIIRTSLFTQLEANQYNIKFNRVKHDDRGVRLRIIKDVFYLAKQFFKEYKSIIHTFFLPSKRLNKAKVVFLGLSSHRAEKIGDKFFHKVFDSLKCYFNDEKDVCSLELIEKGHKSPFFGKVYILNSKMLFYYYKKRFLNINKDFLEVSRLKEFSTYLLENFNDLNINEYEIQYRLNKIFYYKDFFVDLFKKINNKYLFIDIYYFDKSMAAILAAKALNIKVCEMQHGNQGPETVGHGRWGCIPIEGYDLMPNLFWTWDEQSFNNIESWTKKTTTHNVILGGNPFLAYLNDYNIATTIETKKNYILFTMQALTIEEKEFFEKFIHGLIKEDKTISWTFRLHPLYIKTQKKWLEDFFAKYALTNVSIQTPDYPLSEMIINAKAHITFFSTVAIESFSLGKKNIILGKNGYEYFKEFSNEESFLFVRDGHNINEKIFPFLNKKDPPKSLEIHSLRVAHAIKGIVNE